MHGQCHPKISTTVPGASGIWYLYTFHQHPCEFKASAPFEPASFISRVHLPHGHLLTNSPLLDGFACGSWRLAPFNRLCRVYAPRYRQAQIWVCGSTILGDDPGEMISFRWFKQPKIRNPIMGCSSCPAPQNRNISGHGTRDAEEGLINKNKYHWLKAADFSGEISWRPKNSKGFGGWAVFFLSCLFNLLLSKKRPQLNLVSK